jgi:hypothetical protein
MTGFGKKLIYTILAVAVVAALAAAALCFRRGYRLPPVLPDTAELTPATVARPGRPAVASAELRLPWTNGILKASARQGNETAVSVPVRVTQRRNWGYRHWRVEAEVRPLASQGCGAGEFVLTLRRALPEAPDGELKIAIPAPQVAANGEAPAAEVQLAAPELPPAAESHRKWWYATLLSIPAAVLLWLLFRRRRRAQLVVPPWVSAGEELAKLERDLARRDFPAAEGVRRLSDILRGYLTARFDLPVVTETTAEFIAGAADAKHLEAPDREFLRNFLGAADLVKFARVPADRSELERSVEMARLLVDRTVPPPEPAAPEVKR